MAKAKKKPTKKKAAPETEPGGRFTAHVSREYTGRVQYANDRAGSIKTNAGVVRRGEVFAASESLAFGLVDHGDFAHVAADTPLGVDGDKEPKPAAEPISDEPTNT